MPHFQFSLVSSQVKSLLNMCGIAVPRSTCFANRIGAKLVRLGYSNDFSCTNATVLIPPARLQPFLEAQTKNTAKRNTGANSRPGEAVARPNQIRQNVLARRIRHKLTKGRSFRSAGSAGLRSRQPVIARRKAGRYGSKEVS